MIGKASCTLAPRLVCRARPFKYEDPLDRKKFMGPLAMLLGIVLGSAVSITVALVLTLIVFLFLPEFAPRIAEEFPPLIETLVVTAVLAILAASAFYGELRERAWRRTSQGVLLCYLLLLGWQLWPQ